MAQVPFVLDDRVVIREGANLLRTHPVTGTGFLPLQQERTVGVVETTARDTYWVVFENGLYGWFDASELELVG